MEDLIQQIESFSKLKKNWDGYGAEPVHESAIARAKEFANFLPRAMYDTAQAVPIANGSLQFEWHADGGSLELEIDENDIRYLKCPDDDDHDTWYTGLIPHSTWSGWSAIYKLCVWWLKGRKERDV